MSPKSGPAHVVVDGSNIATEGRSLPSLAQLSEAVASFMDEHPNAAITVVVDATFGHRIDKKEAKEFEEGISNNELVAPPAGAVGRGDAFVLGIADKANATVLSNDSFQEFHGTYEWLFDEGRLIGGKPVPHVGWVWVDRIPVRGPVSRKATRGSSSSARTGASPRSRSQSGSKPAGRRSSKAASEPMPVPSAPPPRATAKAEPAQRPEPAARRAPKAQESVNELLPFLEFVEHHPVGTSVNGTVDAYSSHGAYITIGDQGVRGYVPLRLMGDPPPRSAKKVMKLGESVTVVVASFAPARRSIDCALPDMARSLPSDSGASSEDPARKPARKRSAAKKSAAKGLATKKTADATTAATEPAAKKPPAKKTAAKKPPAKKPPAKKTAAKKTAAKKPPAKKTAAKTTAAKKAAAKKTPAKKTAAKKTAARKSTATGRSAATNAPSRRSPAKAATEQSGGPPAKRRSGAGRAAKTAAPGTPSATSDPEG